MTVSDVWTLFFDANILGHKLLVLPS